MILKQITSWSRRKKAFISCFNSIQPQSRATTNEGRDSQTKGLHITQAQKRKRAMQNQLETTNEFEVINVYRFAFSLAF